VNECERLFSRIRPGVAWTDVKVVEHQYFVVPSKRSMKSQEQIGISMLRVVGGSKIDTKTDQHPIGMILTINAVVLRWTETDNRAVFEKDTDTTIAPERNEMQSVNTVIAL
jgi:hypothetical protein